MTRIVWLAARAAILLMTLTACSANHNSIFRTKSVDPRRASIMLVDAKQRAILVSAAKEAQGNGADQTDNVQRFCAEPSPDVFSVVAQALSAGGSFGQQADPETLQLALNAAFSSSEQGATIPRTQTVNMLRELMYRTCERYLNRGIGDLELPIQAARDQRLMVSILAIESLTGTVTPKPIIIGASANASNSASGAEAAIRLDDAYKDLRAKQAASAQRLVEYNSVNTNDICEGIRATLAKGDKLDEIQEKAKPECQSKFDSLTDAKDAAAKASAHYDELRDVANSGISASTSAGLMDPKSDGGLNRIHDKSISSVAKTVREIVRWNMDQDEFLFFCLKIIDPRTDRVTRSQASANATVDVCFKYINSVLEIERSKNDGAARKLAAEFDQSVQTERIEIDEQFERFWLLVSDDSEPTKLDGSKLAKIRRIAISREIWPPCFDTANDKESYRTCFLYMDLSQIKRDLSNLGGQ